MGTLIDSSQRSACNGDGRVGTGPCIANEGAGKTQQRSAVEDFLGVRRVPRGPGSSFRSWDSDRWPRHLQNDHLGVYGPQESICPIPLSGQLRPSGSFTEHHLPRNVSFLDSCLGAALGHTVTPVTRSSPLPLMMKHLDEMQEKGLQHWTLVTVIVCPQKSSSHSPPLPRTHPNPRQASLCVDNKVTLEL